MGRGWAKMVHPDDIANVSQVWAESLRTATPHCVEFRVQAADGQYRYVQSRAVPVLEPNGAVREWVGTLTDITENKLVEQERLRLYFLASENNRLKDEFLAMLAHELRNPLSAMRNAVEVMRIASADESLRSRTRDIIDRQVSHLTRLVDDLLDVSRVTQGKIHLRLTSVDLSGIVWSSVEVARPAIESRRQKLTVRIPESGVVVRGDATRIEQVLINLLQNAAKYSNTGGSIEIALSEIAGKAILRVKDDGIGIPADLLPRIFDLFAQDNNSAGRSEGGLGIGLTIARNLIEMHGGTLRAFSEGAGKGSEFVIELPLASSSVSHAGLRAMVIDDNIDAAEAMALMLNLSGHTVRIFHNGLDALQSVDAIKPHVVLLDIGLPGMDGFEIASRIRRLENGSSIRLIAVSGYGEPDDRLRGHRSGFDHYLVKPVDPNALGSLLREMFGASSPSDWKGRRE
jgi:two-component system, chemotaxis family, CheB/CheR fusion protein